VFIKGVGKNLADGQAGDRLNSMPDGLLMKPYAYWEISILMA
jgi:hypothetical protein